MITPQDPLSQSKAVTPGSTRRVTRRTVLGGIGTVGLASLAGCLGVFGAEPVNSEQNATDEDGLGSGGGQTPARTSTTTNQPDTSDGTPEPTSEPDPDDDRPGGLPNGPGVMPGDIPPSYTRYPERFDPIDRVYVGPITSPATNDWNPHYDDPEPGKKLADVAVHNSTIEDWVVSPPHTMHRVDGQSSPSTATVRSRQRAASTTETSADTLASIISMLGGPPRRSTSRTATTLPAPRVRFATKRGIGTGLLR